MTNRLMKTKTVELWCDLWPGWQDRDPVAVFVNGLPPVEKPDGARRVKIIVELPCFGGSAEVDATVAAEVQIA